MQTMVDLPVQLIPSPVYPSIQVHVKLPGVFVQIANALQPPFFDAHSSISTPTDIIMMIVMITKNDDNDDSYSYSYRVTLFNELFSEESCSVIGLSEKMGLQL